MAMFAKSFDVLYLRHCGYSGADIGVMSLCTGIAGFFAAPLNGAIPDAFALRNSAHGRPCAAQVSVVAGAAAFAVWVLMAPHISIMALTGIVCVEVFVGGWVTPGVKLPILTEIVNPMERATTMAWLATLEGSLGGLLGPPSVGFLSEHVFGYQPVRSGEVENIEIGAHNRQALGSALLWCTLIPWFLQACVFFPMLHCTYAKDSKRGQGYTHDILPEVVGSSSCDDQKIELSGTRPLSPCRNLES